MSAMQGRELHRVAEGRGVLVTTNLLYFIVDYSRRKISHCRPCCVCYCLLSAILCVCVCVFVTRAKMGKSDERKGRNRYNSTVKYGGERQSR